MIESALDKYLTVIADANGRAVIVANPDRANETWKANRYQCHTNSALLSELTVYSGSELAGSRVDFTKDGNDDISENFEPITVPPHGKPLRFVWSGCTAASLCEISIQGKVETATR